MASFKVTCIIKPNANSSHEHITAIGYNDSGSIKINITVKEAVRRIDLNPSEFYVQHGNDKVYVTVVRTAGHEPYIKTVPDHTQKDNLLSLPQC